MAKVMYLDTETTGLDPFKHDIHELAMIVEIDGLVMDRHQFFIRPFNVNDIDPRALEVSGVTKEKILAYRDPRLIHAGLVRWLARWVDKYDRTDKFWIIGYNIRFDVDFLSQFWIKAGDSYFGSYFRRPAIDVMSLALTKSLMDHGFNPVDHKLTSIARELGIEFEAGRAHEAFFDVVLTREVFYKLLDRTPAS